MEDNPFPAVMGRVCYHPCETACNRGQLDEAVGINSVERFLGDEAIKQRLAGRGAGASRSGKRVLVVGAGPSGLSAAYHLTRLGHAVTIHEAGPLAGGMMRFGIPKYRLPRDVLDAEIAAHPRPGRDAEAEHARSSNVARGDARGRLRRRLPRGRRAHRQARLHPGRRGARGSLDAVSLLQSMEGEERPLLGRRVVVYGGGNTAMDVARTAKRLGADRRDRRLPAHARADAGPRLRGRGGARGGRDDASGSRPIKHADDGKLLIERMELDETGFPQPTGEFEELEADSLVLALGQEADLSLLEGVPGIEVDDGVVAGRAEHDDRPRRASSPAATWCRPSAP